jgi:hypothetical protein
MMKTIPKWTLIAITLIFVSYACVLGYVAIETERDVQFWPPRIGPVPKPDPLVNIGELKSDLTEINTILSQELVSMNAKLADARTNMAAGSSVGGQSSYEWRQNVRSYEKDIYRIEDDVISRMRTLENKLESLMKSCVDPGLIDE